MLNSDWSEVDLLTTGAVFLTDDLFSTRWCNMQSEAAQVFHHGKMFELEDVVLSGFSLTFFSASSWEPNLQDFVWGKKSKKLNSLLIS